MTLATEIAPRAVKIPAGPNPVGPGEPEPVNLELNPIEVAVVGLFLLAGLWALYVARPVVLPVVVAFVLRLLLLGVAAWIAARWLSRRVQERDQVMAAVSHDLRTPLVTVIGATSSLSESYDALDDTARKELVVWSWDQEAEPAGLFGWVEVGADTDRLAQRLLLLTVVAWMAACSTLPPRGEVPASHALHAAAAASTALARLADAGHVLISQSVLLKGVNADVATLSALMRAFVENRVKPYYLHHPDFAPGTASFRLSLEEGQALVKSLRGHLSGLCQPTYILDIPGGAGKIPVGPAFLSACETPGAEAFAEDRHGERHLYPPG